MEELRKALLTSASGSGEALIPEDLEAMLIEYLGREFPLWNFIEKMQANGKTHEYNKRTSLPTARFEGELSPQVATSSVYSRETEQLKILRTWGGVSGFGQTVTAEFIDALSSELVGSVEAMANLVEFSIMYGNDIDTYQFNGLDTQIAEDTTAKKSITNGGSVLNADAVVTLTHLDSMIDAVTKWRGTTNDPLMFLMSPQMISKVSGLETKLNRDAPIIEYPGGFRMNSYRGVPIYRSSLLSPASTTTSPTVTATAAAGGSLADDEYFYAISSVTEEGEQLVGVIDSATTSGTDNSVDLTWTADATAYLYKIWRGTVTGADTMYLLNTIAARAYNANGSDNGDVAAWSDEGVILPAAQTAIWQPLTTGEEQMFLINLNPDRGIKLLGMRDALGSPIDTFLSYVPLATRSSAFEYLLESFMAMQLPHPKLCSVGRRVKLA